MFAIEVVVMFGAPVALGWLVRRRYGTPWMLLAVGAVTFIASQVVHLPLNAGLTAMFQLGWLPAPPEAWKLPFNAAVLGLTAGLCEEVARYLVYRHWIKAVRTWKEALTFGAGHGGIESILTGLLVTVTLVSMVTLRDASLTQRGLPPEQATEAVRQVAAFWETPVYVPLLAAAERLMAMLLHLALAALVLQVFRLGRLWPLWAAIGWHAAVNAVVVYVNGTWGAEASEAALAALSLVSAGILWLTWRADRQERPNFANKGGD
jgi:uncharacterized membrane protein YhfC